MTKLKRKILLVILLLLTAFFSLTVFGGIVTKAETYSEDNNAPNTESEAISPRGLYTKMIFAIDGGGGQVWFTAKNQFTLFPSVVTVKIELYRSDTYQESYTNMTLVASNSIHDLDQGKTLKAAASTDGKQSYWKARGYYKRDSADWVENITDTVLFDADGFIVL